MRLAFLSAALAVSLFVACGGDGDKGGDDAADEPRPEDALAQSILLTVSDFPVGWAEALDEQDDGSPFRRCESPTAGLTGRADSGDISRGGSATINQTVAVFEDGTAAAGAADYYVSKRLPCIVKAFNDGAADDDEVEFREASLSEVSFPTFGESSTARRLRLRAKGSDGTAAAVFLDIVVIRKARVLTTVVATDVLTPFSELEKWAALAAGKLP